MVVSAVHIEVLFCDGLRTHTVAWLCELRETGGIRIQGALSKLTQHFVGSD